MRANLAMACEHHYQFIDAIEMSDVAWVVRLVFDHWELSRRNMEMLIAPASLASDARAHLKSEAPDSREARARSVVAWTP